MTLDTEGDLATFTALCRTTSGTLFVLWNSGSWDSRSLTIRFVVSIRADISSGRSKSKAASVHSVARIAAINRIEEGSTSRNQYQIRLETKARDTLLPPTVGHPDGQSDPGGRQGG
ncbi:hypothetical protein [Chachezhania sediminis]|uniref:hypothetical protein n=1 Tax=Chachezhania sediminis TaxID=2599291 RepID=UPI00131EA2FB